MKKTITILFLFYTAIFLFGLLAIYAQVGIPQKTIYRKVEIPIERIVYKEVQAKTTRYDLIQEALTAAENSGEYEKGVYDCSQFSRALVHELADRGFWGTISYGYKGDEAHAWVGLQIESQTGRFLGPNAYKLDPQVGIWDRDQLGE